MQQRLTTMIPSRFFIVFVMVYFVHRARCEAMACLTLTSSSLSDCGSLSVDRPVRRGVGHVEDGRSCGSYTWLCPLHPTNAAINHHHAPSTKAKDIHYFRSTCTFHYDGSIPLLSSPLLLPATMPPKNKKKGADDGDAKFMRAARFGRVKNDLKMGFVGLPNVGKSTLTNILAGACHAEAANYVRYFWFIDNTSLH